MPVVRIEVHRNRFVLVGILVAACGGDTAPVTPSPPASSDQHSAAIKYLDSAITLMQTSAFYRRRVKWDSVRANAHVQAAGALSPAETYAAIRQALLSLGDHHSFLLGPSAATSLVPLSTPGASSPIPGHKVDSLDGELLGGRYGFIHVPTFSQTPSNAPVTLTDTLQALIRTVDANDPCGWIVDLRHNFGGNMWPMLAGVGPILGNDDRAGFFIDADSGVSTWFYSNGSSGILFPNGSRGVVVQSSRAPYILRHPNPPVAVLTDSLTASSGEAIVVAFRGLARARSFGGATYGVPTANSGFALADGAQLFLMVALDADRNMTWYSQRIPADEPIFLSTYPATDDAVVTAAMNWLATRGTCPSS